MLAHVYMSQRRFAAALEQAERCQTDPPDPLGLSVLGACLAHLNRREEALKIVATLERMAEAGYVESHAIAQVHIALGNIDQAIESVARSLDEREAALKGVQHRLGSAQRDLENNAASERWACWMARSCAAPDHPEHAVRHRHCSAGPGTMARFPLAEPYPLGSCIQCREVSVRRRASRRCWFRPHMKVRNGLLIQHWRTGIYGLGSGSGNMH
jgi:hypothetical protein